MDIKQIRRVVSLMKDNDLTEFELEDQGFRMVIKRSIGQDQPVMVSPSASAPIMVAPPAAAAAMPVEAPAGAAGPAETAAEAEDSAWEDIRSPIVGTFYRSPAPDADPFVSVGQQVEEDSVICIVEAMKVMNEIKAETRGVIRKILVDNATPVEYGQPLFKIEKV